MPQITVHLKREEASALQTQGRLKRLNEEAGRGTRLQLLDVGRQDPCLLITGTKEESVEAARKAVFLMLHKGCEGLVVPLHLHDIQALRKTRCTLLGEVEEKSGCRVILEDRRDEVKRDLDQKQPCLRLLGTQSSQAHAVQLLAQHCTEHVLTELIPGKLSGSGRSHTLKSFDPVKRGHNVEITEDHRVARAKRSDGSWNPSHCVLVGFGAVDVHERGAFFCLGVRRVETDRRFRGGTRLGVSSVPVSAPLPDCLLKQPCCSWVLGRGMARGPDGRNHDLPAASFDHLAEGDELGFLVTRAIGSVAVFRRPRGGDEWICIVHVDTRIPEPHDQLHALLELSGRLLEVELLWRAPPSAPVGFATDPAPSPSPSKGPAAEDYGERTEDSTPAQVEAPDGGEASEETALSSVPPEDQAGQPDGGELEDLTPRLMGVSLVDGP